MTSFIPFVAAITFISIFQPIPHLLNKKGFYVRANCQFKLCHFYICEYLKLKMRLAQCLSILFICVHEIYPTRCISPQKINVCE